MNYIHFNVIGLDPRNRKEFLFIDDSLTSYYFKKLSPICIDKHIVYYTVIGHQVPDIIWEAVYSNSALAELFEKVYSSYVFPTQLVKVTILRT